MKKIVVLGAGRVGGAIVRDLAKDGFAVTAADASEAALSRLAGVERVTTARADLSDPAAIDALVAGADLVVGAVPGFMGFQVLEQVIRGGKDVVDISFFDKDAFLLDALATEQGVTAVVDCGVAPGCSNLILGRMEEELDEVRRFACFVGGLPAVRSWPYEYKAPFSPIDVIEEYTRPARMRRGGSDVVLPALSEVEPVEVAGVGTLEAFNTDGLRSLLRTSRAPTLIEKTMRYPGHAERMRMLRDTGFFGTEPVEVAGARLAPRELTARLLFEAWRLGEEEEDLTAMRVEVEGVRDGRPVRRAWEMLDRYDAATRTHSMARTTGYTCTAAVRLVASGAFRSPGINPPEFLGRDEACYRAIFADLAARGVRFEEVEPAGRGPA